MQIYYNPDPAKWGALALRPVINPGLLAKTVNKILGDVQNEGDKAIIRYNREFSGVELDDFAVSQAEIDLAVDRIDPKLKAAIESAVKNIDAFHRAQIRQENKIQTAAGVYCWRKPVAIENVGFYVPGGSAPLFSTLLMLAVPAKIAGCKQIIICSPPNANGNVAASILYCARLLGIDKIYKIGGAQAIGAMAYGTATVPAVYKIFGPGNQYVTVAKQMVNITGTAIDMPAGPSEVAIIADKSASPIFIAADLIAQAEHGPDSQTLLLTDHEPFLEQVPAEIEKQIKDLPRAAFVQKSLHHSKAIHFDNLEAAVDFSNYYAPEHLIVMTRSSDDIISKIINAGSVFIGDWSPEAAGDYASGTNHTLPTGGFARNYSGVSLDSFYKYITFQELTRQGIKNIGPLIETMANAEQLAGHARSVMTRLEILDGEDR